MLINESGLVRCIKRAYKSAGYAVAAEGDCMTIYTEQWYIQCKRAAIPRKVLATIVEHMGMIPEKNVPTSILKDEDPQLVLKEVAADDMSHWRGGQRGERRGKAVRALVEHERRIERAQAVQQRGPLGVLAREEAAEVEAGVVAATGHVGRRGGRGTRQHLHGSARLAGSAHEAQPRVRHAGHARVRAVSDGLAV